MLARAVHNHSGPADQPFIPYNCKGVARDVLDSHLFGHRRGAFTSAQDPAPGVIRAAQGGTLLLDEIGELDLDVQPKLLRLLDTGEIHPLGEPKPIQVDVRIIAATNANIDQLATDGRFREDLFYRLNVIRLRVPPSASDARRTPPVRPRRPRGGLTRRAGTRRRRADRLAVLCQIQIARHRTQRGENRRGRN